MDNNYVLVCQAYGKESDTWDVVITDEFTYNSLWGADTPEALEEAVENYVCLEMLCEDAPYGIAMTVASTYAKDNILSGILVVPCRVNNDGEE